MEINTLEIFMLLRRVCSISALLCFEYCITISGAKFEFKVDARLIIALGTTLATDNSPIMAGLTNRFASSKSRPVISMLPP